MKQQLELIGNLGSDPEMRYFQDGTAVTNFSLATNRRWGKGEEKQEEVTWFRVSVVGKQAEACNEYLKKGRLVSISGRLQPDKNGGPRTFQRGDSSIGASYEVRAFSVLFLGGPDSVASGGQAGQASGQASGQVTHEEEDEIPF